MTKLRQIFVCTTPSEGRCGAKEGPVVFIYPDDVWYTRVTPADVPRIVERHLVPARAASHL